MQEEETGSHKIEKLRRVTRGVETWVKWLGEERDLKSQTQEGNALLESLQAQIDAVTAWSDQSPTKSLVLGRCEELLSEVHDAAHRYKVPISEGREDPGRGL